MIDSRTTYSYCYCLVLRSITICIRAFAMIRSTVYLWLLFALAVAPASAEKNTRVDLDKIVVKILDPDVIEDLKLQLVQVNNHSYISGLLRIKRNVDQISVRSTMDLRKENNKTLRLFDVQIDACQFFKGTHKSKLFNMFLKSVKRHLSGELSCPIKANFNYTLDNWHIRASDFPGYMPETRFEGFTEFQQRQKKLTSIKYFGQIKRN